MKDSFITVLTFCFFIALGWSVQTAACIGVNGTSYMRSHSGEIPSHDGISLSQTRSLITSISISFRSDAGRYTMQIHTKGDQPAFSEPIRWGTNGISITFFDSALSQNFSRATPSGPVMAYSLDAENNNVILKVIFDSNAVMSRISRSNTGTDILIGFSKAPTAQRAEDSLALVRDAIFSTSGKTRAEKHTKVTTAITPADRWKLDTIVIDPGHGGWNNGAMSRSGLKEKDLSLSVAKLLGRMLEKELGINVEYTRTTDEFIPLADRGRFANESGGKLFISIHANYSSARSARGVETYFLGTHRSDSARVVMERENEIVEFEHDSDAYSQMGAGELATRRIAQSAYLQQSEKLAAMIQSQFADNFGRKDRGVKQAGFYVLFGASMPAVLVELGFLSNNREADYLQSDEGQLQMARAIFQAITGFKSDYEKALNITNL